MAVIVARQAMTVLIFIGFRILKANFNLLDHSMNVDGHIVGISLTANKKYLLVNVRLDPTKSEVRYCLWNSLPMIPMIDLEL